MSSEETKGTWHHCPLPSTYVDYLTQCDRASPCSNCVARNKQSLCHYENESARKQQLLEESVNRSADEGGVYSVIKPAESNTAAQFSAFGYAKSNGSNNTTLGIFKKIEDTDTNGALISNLHSTAADHSGLREKYKSLIRQLPAKPFIEDLVKTYFQEVNLQYYPLDEGIFRDLLKSWSCLAIYSSSLACSSKYWHWLSNFNLPTTIQASNRSNMPLRCPWTTWRRITASREVKYSACLGNEIRHWWQFKPGFYAHSS
jgi:hypothetical protein